MADAKQAMVLAFAAWGAKKYGVGSPEEFMQAFQAQPDDKKQAMLQEFQQDPEAQQYMQAAQQQLSGGGTMARLGAKLNYIKRLKEDCPEGQELVYFKKGGRFCKVCQEKKGGTVDEVANFKKARKDKKCGGGKMKK